LEFLGISGNERYKLCVGLEFLGIPSYANYLQFKKLGFLGNFWEWILYDLIRLGIPRNS